MQTVMLWVVETFKKCMMSEKNPCLVCILHISYQVFFLSLSFSVGANVKMSGVLFFFQDQLRGDDHGKI